MMKMISVLASILMAVGFTACGSTEGQPANNVTQTIQEESSQQNEAANNEEDKTKQTELDTSASIISDASTEDKSSDNIDSTNKDSDVLVVYFSATGTTKGVAEKIAEITGADIYEIKPTQEYSSADLDWNDSNSRTTKEQNDPAVRPEIGSEEISLDGYTTIYVGYPIWWGEEPRIMDTFVEKYDFDGKTMIPFCTSGGSSIGKSGQNLASNADSGTWLEGRRFGSGESEDEIKTWIEGLK